MALEIGWPSTSGWSPTSNGLVEIKNSPLLVHDQDTVLDSIEKSFKEGPLAGQTLDDRLKTFGVQSVDASKNLVEKTGFRSHGLIPNAKARQEEDRSDPALRNFIHNLVRLIDSQILRLLSVFA